MRATTAILARGAAIALPVVAAVAAGQAAIRLLDRNPPATPSLATALTVLGIVFAIDVYVSEQSALRLPGALARHAGRARSLTAAYMSALVLAGSAVAAWAWPHRADLASWTAFAAAVLFAAAALFLLRAVIARLEPAGAAAKFVSIRGWAIMRGGLHMARVRRRATDINQLVATLRPIRLVPSPVSSDLRTPISTGKRGFLLPQPALLRRLADRDAWREGHLTLNVDGSLGTLVRAHEEVASVTSDEDTTPTRRQIAAARRAITVRSPAPSDAVGDAVAGLVALVGGLIDVGNHQAAQRTGQALVELIALYLAGAHRAPAPDRNDFNQTLPVLPALSAALSGLAARATQTTGASRELTVGLIDDILQLTRVDDNAPAILRSHIPADADDYTSAELMRIAGRRALELGDDTIFLIRRKLEREAGDGSASHLDAATAIVALAMWLDYFSAEQYWNWLESLLDLTDLHDLTRATRVGAAALEARVFSVAFDVALAIASSDPDAIAILEHLARDEGFTSRAELWSDLEGAYLGRTPADAIERFANFARDCHAAITNP